MSQWTCRSYLPCSSVHILDHRTSHRTPTRSSRGLPAELKRARARRTEGSQARARTRLPSADSLVATRRCCPSARLWSVAISMGRYKPATAPVRPRRWRPRIGAHAGARFSRVGALFRDGNGVLSISIGSLRRPSQNMRRRRERSRWCLPVVVLRLAAAAHPRMCVAEVVAERLLAEARRLDRPQVLEQTQEQAQTK